MLSITPGKIYTDEVSMHSHQFYFVNFTNLKFLQQLTLKNFTEVTIHIKELNGDIALISSLIDSEPKYDDIYG